MAHSDQLKPYDMIKDASSYSANHLNSCNSKGKEWGLRVFGPISRSCFLGRTTGRCCNAPKLDVSNL